MIFYRTVVTAVGDEVADLLDGGVLVLYADGAPPALAEVSVLHQVQDEIVGHTPSVGDALNLGSVHTRITSVGESAWRKVKELGHVVINFNGAPNAERPGEICVEPADLEIVKAIITKNCVITFEG